MKAKEFFLRETKNQGIPDRVKAVFLRSSGRKPTKRIAKQANEVRELDGARLALTGHPSAKGAHAAGAVTADLLPVLQARR
jgi:hypothetical protein